MHHQTHDAYETFGSPTEGPFFVTCEHASNRVPAPLRTTELDRAWMNSHWGYDIGSRTLSLELIRRTGSYGVLAFKSGYLGAFPENPAMLAAAGSATEAKDYGLIDQVIEKRP